MRAIIKGISHDIYDVDTYSPNDLEKFCLNFRLLIGPDCSTGADNFDLSVCTPKWLEATLWDPQWGRGMLIVQRYDFAVIREQAQIYVDGCVGECWQEIATQLSRVFLWEYEGYIP